MRQQRVNHVPEGITPNDSRRPSPSGLKPSPDWPHQAISELTELKRSLAASQQQSESTHRQIEALAKTNACLREELIGLAHKVAEARHCAYHDELTGLPSRRLLLDRLNQAMVQAARQQKQVALILLDLDGFKEINEKYGQAAGDKILRQVAQRLVACIRSTDTACRYEGDEFVIMLPEIDARESAAEMAEKIRARLAPPYVVNEQSMTVTASTGMAVYRGDGQSYIDLIKQADVAMCLAKVHVNSPSFQQVMQN
ncbi:MAG: GGDEF domain-containing protein [Sulfuricaulis sp.]|uniref:GGDEF domain-containing protein n=1 Tax=Sulfuricaulis sp. TaxID=2003553 RepID=UPI0025FE41DE|nr:GGDEF domain-containing protein [Sulfuricaulis sp.]MCR4346435.1 GGDEF domain-containing protein [Sulfuricaulis sp.]